MSTLAVNYYLKALDNYPYDLPQVIESLEYALSYDAEYAQAHCLMGRLCMDYLDQLGDAKYHFEQALVNDLDNQSTYYHFINYCIRMDEFELGKKLLVSARKLKGINKGSLYYKEAILFEKQMKFKRAIKSVNQAIEISLNNSDIDFFKQERKRMENKRKKQKKN